MTEEKEVEEKKKQCTVARAHPSMDNKSCTCVWLTAWRSYQSHLCHPSHIKTLLTGFTQVQLLLSPQFAPQPSTIFHFTTQVISYVFRHCILKFHVASLHFLIQCFLITYELTFSHGTNEIWIILVWCMAMSMSIFCAYQTTAFNRLHTLWMHFPFPFLQFYGCIEWNLLFRQIKSLIFNAVGVCVLRWLLSSRSRRGVDAVPVQCACTSHLFFFFSHTRTQCSRVLCRCLGDWWLHDCCYGCSLRLGTSGIWSSMFFFYFLLLPFIDYVCNKQCPVLLHSTKQHSWSGWNGWLRPVCLCTLYAAVPTDKMRSCE